MKTQPASMSTTNAPTASSTSAQPGLEGGADVGHPVATHLVHDDLALLPEEVPADVRLGDRGQQTGAHCSARRSERVEEVDQAVEQVRVSPQRPPTASLGLLRRTPAGSWSSRSRGTPRQNGTAFFIASLPPVVGASWGWAHKYIPLYQLSHQRVWEARL